MIAARDLIVRRGGRVVLDRVSLQADRGAVIGVIGPNGAGKSTLLSALYRALIPESGEVLLDSEDLSRMRRRDIAREIAVVAQHNDVVMPIEVREVVGLGRLPHRSLAGYGDDADQDIVEDALARVGALDLADRLVSELSGGERQRVMVARAIAQRAGHLLLDEPANHLDIHHQFQLLELVKSVQATTVMVLHDLNLAASACDEIVLLDHGRLVASGPTGEVLDPDLLASVYRVQVRRIDVDGRTHLLFDPASTATA